MRDLEEKQRFSKEYFSTCVYLVRYVEINGKKMKCKRVTAVREKCYRKKLIVEITHPHTDEHNTKNIFA